MNARAGGLSAAEAAPPVRINLHAQRAPGHVATASRASAEVSRPARTFSIDGVQRGLVAPDTPTTWRLAAFTGRFGEISGAESGAPLTLAFRLVHEAQRQGEPVAWIALGESAFFPPDVAEAGVDLTALPVVRTPDVIAAARAADHLIRSGAFTLVTMDLGAGARLPVSAQTRLVGLAKHHDTALVCITEKQSERPSLGSLVSLRAHTERTERDRDRFRCEVRILKDKRRGPGWRHAEVCRGPDGLR